MADTHSDKPRQWRGFLCREEPNCRCIHVAAVNKRGTLVTICHKKHHFSQTLHHESWHYAGDEFLFGFIGDPNNLSMLLYKEIPC
ncbi:MAG: hypothetical protein ACRC2N_06235 [Aeromonas sp.]